MVEFTVSVSATILISFAVMVLLLVTATGSTGYALAETGPIVTPEF